MEVTSIFFAGGARGPQDDLIGRSLVQLDLHVALRKIIFLSIVCGFFMLDDQFDIDKINELLVLAYFNSEEFLKELNGDCFGLAKQLEPKDCLTNFAMGSVADTSEEFSELLVGSMHEGVLDLTTREPLSASSKYVDLTERSRGSVISRIETDDQGQFSIILGDQMVNIKPALKHVLGCG